MTGQQTHAFEVPVPAAGRLWLFGSPDPDPAGTAATLQSTTWRGPFSERRIAGTGAFVVADLPGFGTPLQVEVWDRRPADDLAGWDHGFEFALRVTDVLRVASEHGVPVELPLAAGYYWAQLYGRGLDRRGWADPAVPEDVWRLRLWLPTNGAPDPHPVKRWSAPPAWTGVPGSAGSGRLLRRQSVAVRLSYSAVQVSTGSPVGPEEDPGLVMDRAIERGIAGDHRGVAVITPVQWHSGMPVEVEVWDGEPPCDLDDWDEGHEFGLRVAAGAITVSGYDPDPSSRVPLPDDDYAARLYGRGFDERLWQSPDEPEDHWRLQLWPAGPDDPPREPVRVKVWTLRSFPADPEPYVPPEPAAPEPADSGPDLFQIRVAMSARMGHRGIPDHVIAALEAAAGRTPPVDGDPEGVG